MFSNQDLDHITALRWLLLRSSMTFIQKQTAEKSQSKYYWISVLRLTQLTIIYYWTDWKTGLDSLVQH